MTTIIIAMSIDINLFVSLWVIGCYMNILNINDIMYEIKGTSANSGGVGLFAPSVSAP